MIMKWFNLIITVFLAHTLQAQIINLDGIKFDNEKTVNLKALSNSEDASTFLIEIKDTIKPHYHKVHTEMIYVVEGKAKFYFDSKVLTISKGDFFEIPRNTVHAVKVVSEQALKVLSIQAPQFKGEDRKFVE